ncbi:MAG TPA: hypothetical protein ENO23_02905, partial [Alphaproteobacteria bacterium]|nr:hypothetical protein [Alphaproteobacteria bacterium]
MQIEIERERERERERGRILGSAADLLLHTWPVPVKLTRFVATVLCPWTVVFGLAAVLLAPARADAQTVSVDVVDAGTAAPVVGAVVYLSTDAGAVVARA